MYNKLMNKVVNVYKPISKTPLEALNLFKKKFPEYKDSKLAYAGRLDPMAEGVLLILVDEECKNRDHYQELDKEYEFDLMFGVKSDTFDVLGELEFEEKFKPVSNDDVKQILKSFEGEILQTLPIYSSTLVNGRPLYWWAKSNQISNITIPKRFVKVYKIEFVKEFEISKLDLKSQIISRIQNVTGDFRQEEIIQDWEEFFEKSKEESFKIFRFKANVSSGTYIRALVNDIGKILDNKAITLAILRTKVGEFKLQDSIKLDE